MVTAFTFERAYIDFFLYFFPPDLSTEFVYDKEEGRRLRVKMVKATEGGYQGGGRPFSPTVLLLLLCGDDDENRWQNH